MTTNLSTEDYFHLIRNIYSDAGQANIADIIKILVGFRGLVGETRGGAF